MTSSNASTGSPRQATEDELRDNCDHICLKESGHVERGEPHFYGYRLGPWSQEGLVRQVDELRAEVERLRDEIDDLANGPYYPEDVVRERLRALLDDRTETT